MGYSDSNLMEHFSCPKGLMIYSCFPKFLKIAIFIIIIYKPYTHLSVRNKPVLCLRYDLFRLLYARHI